MGMFEGRIVVGEMECLAVGEVKLRNDPRWKETELGISSPGPFEPTMCLMKEQFSLVPLPNLTESYSPDLFVPPWLSSFQNLILTDQTSGGASLYQ